MPKRMRYRPGRKYNTKLWKLRDDRTGFPILSKDAVRDGNKPELVVHKDVWEPFLNARLPIPTITPSIPDPMRPFQDPTLGNISYCYVVTNMAGAVVGVACGPNQFWNRTLANQSQLTQYSPNIPDQTFNFSPSITAGESFGIVTATANSAGTISFALDDASDSTFYTIDSTTGNLALVTTSGFDVTTQHQVRIRASLISGISRTSAVGTMTLTSYGVGIYGNVFADFRADVSSSLTLSGSNILTWASSYSGTTARTLANGPNLSKQTYVATGLNGYPTISLKANNSVAAGLQYTGTISDFNFLSNGAGATIFMVGQPQQRGIAESQTLAATTGPTLAASANGVITSWSVHSGTAVSNSAAVLAQSAGSTVGNFNTAANSTRAAASIFAFRLGAVGANLATIFDQSGNVTQKTSAYGNVANALTIPFSIFASSGNSTNGAAANISHLLIYRGVLPDANVTAVMTILKNKWGIT